MCRYRMCAWSMVWEMNCGVQTTLRHLLEETTPQKKEEGPESRSSSTRDSQGQDLSI
jgi:hypothetical protein